VANKNYHERDWQPEKVVIVAGPSFGNAISFVLLGAALGAAGALFWASQRGASTHSVDALQGGAKEEARAAQLMQRLTALSGRVRSMASRARETAQQAGEHIVPVIKEAVSEARSTAHETEEQLEEDIRIAVEAGNDVAREQA
jgi:gas vesicle protein